jgi:hypothetical protein
VQQAALWSFSILHGRRRAGIKVLGSADWILGTWKGLPKSRVNAACLEIQGQPFYGWFADGSSNKIQARFQRAFPQA